MLAPYLGAWFGFEGQFPDGYFDYPPVKEIPKAGFSWTYFIIFSIIGLFLFTLFVFPRIFGFKKPKKRPKKLKPQGHLPFWFWIGLVMWLGTLFVLVGKFSEPRWLINWADLPLFWGLTFVLDGIVNYRTGESIMSTHPKEIVGIGIASISGWMLFEYLNFFVESNWIYPEGVRIPSTEFLLYAVLGSSGLMPLCFQMYSLLNSIEGFKERYMHGLVVKFSNTVKIIILLLGIGGMFATGYYPDNLFFLLWLGPLAILTVVIQELGIWTPFRPIKEKGNWSPVLVFALTYLIVGVILECQNYFSAIHINGQFESSFNPSFWEYSLPYVNVYHVFEMPLLGYLGYLPFSIYCWIWWIIIAYLMGVPAIFTRDPYLEE